MREIERMLEKAAPILRAVKAPPKTPPARAIEALNKALEKKIPHVEELSEAQMRALILKFLRECPSDGFDLVKLLEERKLCLEGAGDGGIYALLGQLEASGYLEGQWREQGARMAKIYRVTEKGGDFLGSEAGAMPRIGVWLQMLLHPQRT